MRFMLHAPYNTPSPPKVKTKIKKRKTVGCNALAMRKLLILLVAAIALTGCVATSSIGPILQKTYGVVNSAAELLAGLDALTVECPQLAPYIEKVGSVEKALVKSRDVLKKVGDFLKIEMPTQSLGVTTNQLETLVAELEVEADKLIR